MMAFTEKGFIWIKTIENKRGKSSSGEKKDEQQSLMQSESKLMNPNDNQEIKYEQVEKVFEHIFLTKKESWSISIEKLLIFDTLNRQSPLDRSNEQSKVESLKVVKENNDNNIVIEISSKQKMGEDVKEKFQYIRTTQEFIDLLINNKSVKPSPLGVLTIEGSTYEFGDYIIRIGKMVKQKKVKIQIEYTPSKFEIGQNQNLEDYANKVIKPVLQHLFQNFEEFREIREGTSEKELDAITQEPKYFQLSKELSEIPHPFKSTRFFIKSYFDDTFTK